MMRLVRGRLRWQRADILALARVVGDEAAYSQQAPANAAIARLAQGKGVQLSPRVAGLLERVRASHALAHQLRQATDAPVVYKNERRAWPHQRAALQYFRRMALPAYLVADKTGVGKTLQALLWARNIAHSERTLIITKNILKEQWAADIREFISAQDSITIVDGTIAQQTELAKSDAPWVIGHWQSLNNAIHGYLDKPWDAIILDEAHYITNPKAYRSESAYLLRAPHRMAMTANPFSKNPAELNGILRFLYPKIYKSYWRFFHMHVRATPRPFGGFTVDGARRPKLMRWEIAPFTLMRTKQQVFPSLPRIARERIPVRLSKRGLKEYDRLRKAVFAELDALEGGSKYVPIINDLVRVTRLRQYLIDPAIIGGRELSVKYPAILDLLDTIRDPTVVFTQYKKAAVRLGPYLQQHGKTVEYIHGGIKKTQVPDIKRRFQAGRIDALVVVADSGDTGLNLGGFGYVVALDLPWTVRGLEQYEGRVDRPQERTGKLVPTTSYRVIVEDSYEPKMERRLVNQDNTVKSVFTISDLRELFA
jgi:SNF2 family DNA or RNA helicase